MAGICLPVPDSITVTLLQDSYTAIMQDMQDDGLLDIAVKAQTRYPRYHVAGFDLAGSLWDIGVWAEGSVFFPEKVIMKGSPLYGLPVASLTNPLEVALQASLSQVRISDSTIINGKPYFKFVIGADYTFPVNVYVNLQYVHGFVHERGSDIEDYLMGNLDWKLFNEKLKLTPVGVGLEIKDFSDITENYAFVAQPAVAWYPIDNAELSLEPESSLEKKEPISGKSRIATNCL